MHVPIPKLSTYLQTKPLFKNTLAAFFVVDSFFFFLSLRLLENALLNDAFTLSKADYSNQQFCRQELNCKDETIKSFKKQQKLLLAVIVTTPLFSRYKHTPPLLSDMHNQLA